MNKLISLICDLYFTVAECKTVNGNNDDDDDDDNNNNNNATTTTAAAAACISRAAFHVEHVQLC